MKKTFIQHRPERKIRLSRSMTGDVFLILTLAVFGVFMILPMVYTVVTAFKPIHELFLFPPRFFVKTPTMDNFRQMVQLTTEMYVPFSRYLFNSLVVTGGGTAAYVFIASLAAYPIAKFDFRFLKVFQTIVVWAILFRGEVTAIPQYIVISKLGLLNTYLAVVFPILASTFGVFLMIQFIRDFPDTILEAAHIDGAGHFETYWRIVMPSIRPAWLTLIIFTFQSYWNSTGIQYIYDESMKMLPTVLQQITTGGMARAGASAAVALVLMIPPIAIFVLAQASVMETMAKSGLK
jgi:putative chitobiose transport system permease protein